MEHKIASSEAHFLEALALASAASVRAGGREAMTREVLGAVVRPGVAVAAALVSEKSGVRSWCVVEGLRSDSAHGSAPSPDFHPAHRGAPKLLEDASLQAWMRALSARPVHAVEAPLRIPGVARASLVLILPGQPNRLPGAESAFAAALAGMLAVALARVRASRRLRQVATRDDLTHALNFRYLKTALRKELERAAQFRRPLSLIMLDVDHLKHYNEQFGHIRGSELLRDLSRIVLESLPEGTHLAKYGGDEFVIILPGTGRDEAISLGEAIRARVASHPFELAEAGEVTASFGVAIAPLGGCAPRDILESADRALFWAKNSGRNRLRVAG